MKFSLGRALIIARREYLTTVRRKAFVFWLLYTPTILFFSTFLSQKLSQDDFNAHFRQARVVAVVDSGGVYGSAPRQYVYVPPPEPALDPHDPHHAADKRDSVRVTVHMYPDQQSALDSLAAGNVTAVLVVSKDFLATGRLRRYEKDTRAVTASGDDRPLRWWLHRGLLGAPTDSARVARSWDLSRTIPLYTPDRNGAYAIKDDAREYVAIFLPLILGMLLAMSIMMGGQYMLQGISEEKESRILESLLCTVTPDDLMLGKLLGLGSAGLTLVSVWIAVGLVTLSTSFAFLHIDIPPQLLMLGFVYFLGGYLFYGSLMTGIGAITGNMREAQQFSVVFTIMNFFPFWVLMKIINSPGSALAVGLSMFPPTAATTMMMRLSASAASGAAIPAWQIGMSLALLFTTAYLTLRLCAKIFRIGLLLYGKTPNLPEILRIVRKD